MRETAKQIVSSALFQKFIFVVIFINAITIGIETADLDPVTHHALSVFDSICLGIYVIEAVLKLVAWRGSYFRDGWNVFDFSIILISLLPSAILPFPSQVIRILRVLRVFRVLRLVSAFKEIRIIVQAIGKAIPGMAWTAFLLLIVYYIFAVIGTDLYGQAQPEYFGNLGASFFTLFQTMTLDDWAAGIARKLIVTHPGAIVYFVLYVIISAFIIVNIVLGIIVDVFESTRKAEKEADRKERLLASDYDPRSDLEEQLKLLREQIAHIETLVGDINSESAQLKRT